MFARSLAAGTLDQDAAHGLGRRGEEVAPAVPAGVLGTDQAEIGLMHQGGRLERLAGLLPGQPLGGQFPQLVIDQGKELLGRPRRRPERRRKGSGSRRPSIRLPDSRPGAFPTGTERRRSEAFHPDRHASRDGSAPA